MVRGTINNVSVVYNATFTTRKAPRINLQTAQAPAPPPLNLARNIPLINLSDIVASRTTELLSRDRYVNALLYGQKGTGKTCLALDILKAKQRTGFKIYIIHC